MNNIEELTKRASLIMQDMVANSEMSKSADDINHVLSSIPSVFTNINEDKIIKELIKRAMNILVRERELSQLESSYLEFLLDRTPSYYSSRTRVDKILSDKSTTKNNTINIVLEKQGYDFKLTHLGMKSLIDRKKEKGLSEWTETFINKNRDKIWFRVDEDLVDLVDKYGVDVTNGTLCTIELPEGVTISDDIIELHDLEDFGFEELVFIDLEKYKIWKESKKNECECDS